MSVYDRPRGWIVRPPAPVVVVVTAVDGSVPQIPSPDYCTEEVGDPFLVSLWRAQRGQYQEDCCHHCLLYLFG